MKGKYHIVVQNNRLRYELDVKRNITILRGNSATGKTTLINMIQEESIMNCIGFIVWARYLYQ